MATNSASFTPSRPLDYSESEVVKEIRRVILDECKGTIPNQTQFLKLARVSHWTIKTKFGTYAQAIQKAGFVHVDTRTRFTRESVIMNLREVLKRTDGYFFTFRVYRQSGGSYSFNTIKSVLDASNWANVMETIDAKPKLHLVRITAHAQRLKVLAKLTQADLFEEIDRVWQVTGGRPTYSEFRNSSRFGIKIYESQFGSWLKAVESFCIAKGVRIQGKAGTRVTKKMLLDELQSLQRKRPGDLLTYDFYKANGGTYSIGTFQTQFQSWTNAINTIGGISGNQARHSKDKLFDELQRLWEQLGKQPSWNAMRTMGEISPKSYSSVFGTWSNAVYAFCEDRNSEDRETDSSQETTPTQPNPDYLPNELAVQKSTITVPDSGQTALIELRSTGRSVSTRLRFRVFQRDNFTCKACGLSPKKDAIVIEVDHIKAYSNGGETVLENLQTLCRQCNSGKSNLF